MWVGGGGGGGGWDLHAIDSIMSLYPDAKNIVCCMVTSLLLLLCLTHCSYIMLLILCQHVVT